MENPNLEDHQESQATRRERERESSLKYPKPEEALQHQRIIISLAPEVIPPLYTYAGDADSFRLFVKLNVILE
ncbi:hypothetical protein BsWGS_19444 [Bradybaena similaris]